MLVCEEAFAVAAPLDVVFAALCDLATVVECLPATRAVDIAGPRHAAAEARVVFGKTTISFSGGLDVVGDDRESHTVSYRVRAKETHGNGEVDGIIDVRLHEQGGKTVVSVSGDAKTSGQVSTLRDEVVKSAADALLSRFGTSLEEWLGTPVTDTGPPGDVTVVTTEPVMLPHPDSALSRIRDGLADHRWIVPAAIVITLGAVVAVRRRS